MESIIGNRRNTNFFLKMLVISLTFHVICSTVFLLGGGRHGSGSQVVFMDLAMSEPVSPTAQSATLSESTTSESEIVEPEPQPVQPKSEVEKLREDLQNAVKSAPENQDAMQKVSFGLGLMNGSFGTLADGRTLRDDMREYYISMLRSINEKWWVNGNRFEGNRGAIINIVISRDGEIVDLRLIQSSGNSSYDRTLIKTLRATSPVPPLPSHFDAPYFVAPFRFNPPLNLLSNLTG